MAFLSAAKAATVWPCYAQPAAKALIVLNFFRLR